MDGYLSGTRASCDLEKKRAYQVEMQSEARPIAPELRANLVRTLMEMRSSCKL